MTRDESRGSVVSAVFTEHDRDGACGGDRLFPPWCSHDLVRLLDPSMVECELCGEVMEWVEYQEMRRD